MRKNFQQVVSHSAELNVPTWWTGQVYSWQWQRIPNVRAYEPPNSQCKSCYGEISFISLSWSRMLNEPSDQEHLILLLSYPGFGNTHPSLLIAIKVARQLFWNSTTTPTCIFLRVPSSSFYVCQCTHIFDLFIHWTHTWIPALGPGSV